MKNTRYMIFALTLLLVLSSCGSPTPETVVVVVTATDAPVTAEAPTSEPVAPMEPVALAGPQSGEEMTWLDGSTLVYIPAGDFRMGDGTNTLTINVTLDGYWMQQTPVTNRMYEQCVKAGACASPRQELGGPVFGNPLFASHPVVGVNWEQAQSYCTWIQGNLPTEAQWEKAARGANGNLYPWGDARPSCSLLNFANCHGSTTTVTLHEDGRSPYGLFDMAGNVFEWVFDWYAENYYLESPGVNPTGPQTGQYRVIRGSSFETATQQLSSAIRRFGSAGNSRRDTGFRCVVDNPQPFAPYCQVAAHVPLSQAAQVDSCTLPTYSVIEQYCRQGDGYAVVQFSFNTIWKERGTRIQCVEQVAGGIRTLVCRGPRYVESTNEITVCNPSCTNQPDISGLSPICPTGYTLDPSTGTCAYSPISALAGAGGCPVGYVARESGGQAICVTGPNAGGSCPVGLYFDDLAGMCVPPNGEVSAPFGIDNPVLAAQTYAGCPTGYGYSESLQCCQAVAGAVYPSCAPGYTLDATRSACVPVFSDELGGEGCINARVTTFKCADPFEEDKVCAPIESESLCVKNTLCKWDEATESCSLRSGPPP
jgi:formylglycine-generating enzyme required for sulfatase activity